MVQKRLNRLLKLDQYEQESDRLRAALVLSSSILILVLATIVFLVARNETQQNMFQRMAENWRSTATVFAIYAGSLFSLILLRLGKFEWASGSLILGGSAAIFFEVVLDGLYSSSHPVFLALIILISVVLLGQRGLLFGTIMVSVMTLIGFDARQTLPAPETVNNVSSGIITWLMLMLVAAVSWLFIRFNRISRQEGAAGARGEQAKQAEIISQIAQRISGRSSLDEVLNNAIEQVRLNYPDIYHAQIYLIDETVARLVASTGEVGKKLLERQHALAVGSQSVIGTVSAVNRAIVARSGDSVHHRNEFLPNTRTEAAFPLRRGTVVIGVLDVQSKQENAFIEDSLPLFQALADHIAIAIDNAQLFEATQRQLGENQSLLDQLSRNMTELNRLNRRLTGQFWQDYLNQQSNQLGVEIDLDENVSVRHLSLTPGIQEAIRFNQSVQNRQAGKHQIAVPLRVRGEVIGAMEFELDEGASLAPEDIVLLEEVSEQLGLAAESNRLFEVSQRMAQREALVNEISSRLQTTSSVEMTLSAAARSLKETLRLDRVSIRLGTPPVNGAKEEVQ